MMPVLQTRHDYVQRHGLGKQRRSHSDPPPKLLRPRDWAGNFMMVFARLLQHARCFCGVEPAVRYTVLVPLQDFLRADVMHVVIDTFLRSFVLPTPFGQFKTVQEGLWHLDSEYVIRVWTCMALTAAFYGAQQADEDAAELAERQASAVLDGGSAHA